jgi:hypothetical protein
MPRRWVDEFKVVVVGGELGKKEGEARFDEEEVAERERSAAPPEEPAEGAEESERDVGTVKVRLNHLEVMEVDLALVVPFAE